MSISPRGLVPPDPVDVVVVGAGHNGLVAACYLAREGLSVEVVEADAAQLTVARLVRDYRAREPAVLVVGDDAAALATTNADARDVLPNGVGTSTLAVADAEHEADLVETVRGEL